jgi:FkbM family methyltransferase
MLSKKIKQYIQVVAQKFGYHILSKNSIAGDMALGLKGLKSRGFEPKNILDVGANTGDWSRETSVIFPNATYYLIEPQLELKSSIDSFLKNHKGKFILGGAGAKKGELLLTIWEDFAGSSFLLPNNEISNSGKQQRTVPIYAIDDLISEGEIPVPDVCKLDVQGFELEVLKGANSIFGKTEVIILEASLFEFMPNQPILGDIIEFLSAKSYVIYDLLGFSNRPYDKALGQVDICFVKKDSFLRENRRW